MLENRETMMQLFPELYQRIRVRPVENYPQLLRQSLAAVGPNNLNDTPTVAVLTPGVYNSAYFEHAFLADQMGVQLVEGPDLRVVDGHVAMRTTEGYKQIDVLYRRVDDAFLDPLTLAGLSSAYQDHGCLPRQHHHRQCAGHRIADGRRSFLHAGDHQILHRPQGDLSATSRPGAVGADSLKYVLEHIHELVIKEVRPGTAVVGPAATKGMPGFASWRQNLRIEPTLWRCRPVDPDGKVLAPPRRSLIYVLVSDRTRSCPG